MRAFVMIISIYAFMAISILAACYVGDHLLEGDLRYLVLGPALFIGMYSRKIVQKVMGYTLEEAYKHDSK